MLFKQLLDKESCTLTYLIADLNSKDAVFIDPVDSQLDIYIDLLNEYDLTLKYSLETHVHADHVTASGELRQQFGAKTAVSSLCGASSADIQIEDGDSFEFAEVSNKSTAIIVYCGSGNRAALSANTLKNMGYTNVMSIAGGYQAWKQQV